MIEDNRIISDIIETQWSEHEKFLNLHSAVTRFIHLTEEGKNPFYGVPKILVEETDFDMCLLLSIDKNNVQENFYNIYKDKNDLLIGDIQRLNNNSLFPSIHKNVCGYHLLYIYPVVYDLRPVGFIVLGKYNDLDDELYLRHVGLLCKCCERICSLFTYKTKKEETSSNLFDKFLMYNYFPYPLIIIENTMRVIWVNEKTKELFPKDIYTYKGEHIQNLFPYMNLEKIHKGQNKKDYIKIQSGDKDIIFEIDQFPIYILEGKPPFTGIILRDVTELKMVEEENLFKEKMETLGMLSAGIAHDFNNMLTGILGYSSLLKNFLTDNERLLKYVEVIERSAERASSLTKQLLNFARKQEKPSHEFDLRIVIEDSLLLLCESLKNISIERDLQAKKCIIKGDESEFQHIFLNLFMNAKDAMEGKGTIKVSSKNITIGNIEYILVTVADTGKGIDEKVKENLFKPHYTTKKSGLNMGLGLYRVEKTVKKYGGFIEVESEKGKGTKFSIYIPINRGAQIDQEKGIFLPETFQEGRLKKKKMVLVVDDEEFIGEMFSIVLNKMGLDVIYCPRGEEALNYLKSKPFDCVILDIIMPGMKGDELLKEIRKMGLSIPVIVSSGYMSEDQRDKVKSLGVEHFLDKPFTEKKIISLMENIIED